MSGQQYWLILSACLSLCQLTDLTNRALVVVTYDILIVDKYKLRITSVMVHNEHFLAKKHFLLTTHIPETPHITIRE